ncbi:response regulator [Pseudomonas grimontii]|uniref:response regulator n=1 Tax=Pseudomonas grimontii TaxID=129847 RepID=UPI00387AF876
MKKVLLVEDDGFKAKSLIDFLGAECPGVIVITAPSLVDAVEALDEPMYDLILVDMAIPSHPTILGGGSPMSLLTGGLEVLLELRSLERKDPCIVITQYPEIEISGTFFSVKDAASKIRDRLNFNVLECIKYSEGTSEWKLPLRMLLENL